MLLNEGVGTVWPRYSGKDWWTLKTLQSMLTGPTRQMSPPLDSLGLRIGYETGTK